MNEAVSRRVERRTRQRAANRGAILDAARRVAAREGAGEISLRAVAGEAGYAPASVYEYFRNRAELVLALAADDLSQLVRALREAGGGQAGAARAALESLSAQATAAEQAGDWAAAARLWRDALPLVPSGTKQYDAIVARVNAATGRIGQTPAPKRTGWGKVAAPFAAGGAVLWKLKFLLSGLMKKPA